MNRDDAFLILGLTPGVSEAEVKHAYRRLCLVVHPDRGGSSEAFIRVNNAYEILTGVQRPADKAPDEPANTYRVATLAMSMLNLDPDEFAQIESLCYAWLGSVSQNNKRAAKQKARRYKQDKKG